ncbi:MAG: DNA polymerase III subunit gamma/tau [Bacteroidales bacterium]|nr:DNA polymerase III subunit gamma/tau [Bacteroidales bacterium]
MENFIVSARKYRPATFDTVVGQKSITTTLKNAIKNNHLAQAFLFCGPRGVGKTTCARILAKTINCKNLTENLEACDKCESCVSFNSSASFNIHELDAASNNSVDDIRNLVDQVRIPPQVGKYKVYIIDEVHMLSASAFNAFLKTLEEPPSYAKFILATTEKHKIIPTILSRCQIYDFKRITIDDIAKHLDFVAKSEDVTAESDALHVIAQKSDGALRDALSIFDQIVSYAGKNITYKNVIDNLNVLDYDYYFKITDFILQGNIQQTLLTINEIIDNGFDGLHFIIGLGEHFRNLLVCKDASTIKLLEVGVNIKSKYENQALNCSVKFLLKALNINNNCDINYKSSNNKSLHLELSLMQMCSINSSSDIQTDAKKIDYSPLQKKDKLATSSYATKPHISPDKNKTTSAPAVPLTTPSSSIYKTTSIKPDEKSEYKKTSENVTVEENKNKYRLSNDFTQEQLQKTWEIFAQSVISDKNYYSTLIKRKPLLKDNFIIEFTVDNKIQENEINENKLDLLGFLRKELKNEPIDLKILIVQNKKEDKPYTSEEKFKKMAEKNPAIIKLKNQLNLEIGY